MKKLLSIIIALTLVCSTAITSFAVVVYHPSLPSDDRLSAETEKLIEEAVFNKFSGEGLLNPENEELPEDMIIYYRATLSDGKICFASSPYSGTLNFIIDVDLGNYIYSYNHNDNLYLYMNDSGNVYELEEGYKSGAIDEATMSELADRNLITRKEGVTEPDATEQPIETTSPLTTVESEVVETTQVVKTPETTQPTTAREASSATYDVVSSNNNGTVQTGSNAVVVPLVIMLAFACLGFAYAKHNKKKS